MSSSSDSPSSDELRARAENAVDIDPAELANWCQTLGATLSSGVPILESLALATKLVRNPRLQYMGHCLLSGVRDGLDFGSILLGTKKRKAEEGGRYVTRSVQPASPPIPELAGFFTEVLAAGEETGNLDGVLQELACYYRVAGISQSSVYQFSHPELLFYRQLSMLQSLGLPILKSLRIIATDFSYPRMKIVIGEVSAEIEAGATFDEALGKFPNAFSEIAVMLAKAGCAGGALEVCLQRMCQTS